jgi:hypothetical protein
MEMLDTALDDIVALVEAHRACADGERLKAMQHELAAGADAYAAVIVASARGEVTQERIERARSEAQAAMPKAWKARRDLARRVEQRRLPLDLVRDDLRELMSLALSCRAGVAAFGTSDRFDAAAAEPLANKVEVELREAVLVYLARVRDAAGDPGDSDFARVARKAAAEFLAKVEPRAAELAKLEEAGAERSGTAQSVVSDGLTTPLRRMAREWGMADEAA